MVSFLSITMQVCRYFERMKIRLSLLNHLLPITALKMKFFIKGFFSKCDQIRWKLQILSHLLKKSLIENLNFCAVNAPFL